MNSSSAGSRGATGRGKKRSTATALGLGSGDRESTIRRRQSQMADAAPIPLRHYADARTPPAGPGTQQQASGPPHLFENEGLPEMVAREPSTYPGSVTVRLPNRPDGRPIGQPILRRSSESSLSASSGSSGGERQRASQRARPPTTQAAPLPPLPAFPRGTVMPPPPQLVALPHPPAINQMVVGRNYFVPSTQNIQYMHPQAAHLEQRLTSTMPISMPPSVNHFQPSIPQHGQYSLASQHPPLPRPLPRPPSLHEAAPELSKPSFSARQILAQASGSTAVASDASGDDPNLRLSIQATERRRYRHESFPQKLYRILSEAEQTGSQDVISFNAAGTAFKIHRPVEFTQTLQEFFRHSRLESFKRQLSMYGFHRISAGPEEDYFAHPLFVRGRPELCQSIKRVSELNVVAHKHL